MPISYLTRIVELTATHRIRRADWTVERNTAEFGKAAVDHSHRYQCRVTVQGQLVPEAGGAMSLPALDARSPREGPDAPPGAGFNKGPPKFPTGARPPTAKPPPLHVWERSHPPLRRG